MFTLLQRKPSQNIASFCFDFQHTAVVFVESDKVGIAISYTDATEFVVSGNADLVVRCSNQAERDQVVLKLRSFLGTALAAASDHQGYTITAMQ